MVTPSLGAASATSVNRLTITAPATAATLTIADNQTLNVIANATLSGSNTGDQNAAGVANTPAGSVTAITVQGAINELDGDIALKANLASPTFTGTLTTPGLIVTLPAPATSGSAGTLGEIRVDTDYIYIAVGANTWKRVAIATF